MNRIVAAKTVSQTIRRNVLRWTVLLRTFSQRRHHVANVNRKSGLLFPILSIIKPSFTWMGIFLLVKKRKIPKRKDIPESQYKNTCQNRPKVTRTTLKSAQQSNLFDSWKFTAMCIETALLEKILTATVDVQVFMGLCDQIFNHFWQSYFTMIQLNSNNIRCSRTHEIHYTHKKRQIIWQRQSILRKNNDKKKELCWHFFFFFLQNIIN